MKHVNIPQNWTAEQALEVFDFLENILHAIWDIYDDRIVEHMINNGLINPHSEQPPTFDEVDYGDEDIPF